MSDDDLEPLVCTEIEVAEAGHEIATDHLEKALEHLSKFAEYRNFRLEFERRAKDVRWARITIIPEPDPATQVPCGFCRGTGRIDDRDCLVCEGRGTVHRNVECVVSEVDAGPPKAPAKRKAKKRKGAGGD